MKTRKGATDARRVRKHNERSILAELRRIGIASKPEIAREVSLTPQAVNGIVDTLQAAGLVQEGGRRSGTVGHPSTLYSISPTGAYAVGIDIGPKRLEAALINFSGHLVYRAQTEYSRRDPPTVRSAVSTAMGAIWKHAADADVDRDRIVGVGVVTPPFLLHQAGQSGVTSETATWWAEYGIKDVIAEYEGLTVDCESEAVVGALAIQMNPEDRPSQSFLYVSLGETISSCLVLDGEVRRGEHSSAGSLAFCPVRLKDGMASLGEVATYAALREHLIRVGFDEIGDIYEAVHIAPTAVNDWIKVASGALSQTLLAVQSVVDFGSVILNVAPPITVGDTIMDELRAEFSRCSQLGLRLPHVRRAHTQAGSAAIAAGALALHRHFSPKIGLLTDAMESTSPFHRILTRGQI